MIGAMLQHVDINSGCGGEENSRKGKRATYPNVRTRGYTFQGRVQFISGHRDVHFKAAMCASGNDVQFCAMLAPWTYKRWARC